MAAIHIAVSIESLLMMIKDALSDTSNMMPAVWMILAVIGQLVGLGLYVYFGARAEGIVQGKSNDGS